MKKFVLFQFFIASLILLSINSCESRSTDSKSTPKDTTVNKVDNSYDAFLKNYNRYFNDVGRLLAGLEQENGSSIKNFDTLAACKEYRQTSSEFFKKLKDKNFEKMYSFVKTECADINKDSMNVLYPFSGPDFLHVNAFFPNAKTTVMFGLEPVGNLPVLKKATSAELKPVFKAVRTSIDSLMQLGYFMTREMSRDFHRVPELNGAMPFIVVFMVRDGYRILNVKRITLNKDGNPVDAVAGADKNNPSDNYVSGGLIEYVKEGEKSVRKLYYFSHDVDDKCLARTGEFIKFIKTIKYDVGFLKAASYLCSWMNTIRWVILDNCGAVIQDDSGIPFKYFTAKFWDCRFYGRYQRTLKTFQTAFFQKDLKQVYDSSKTVKQLDFPFGYGVRINQSNMMIAKKKAPLK